MSLEHFVNDALMALFFFVVGLEIKRELVTGDLRSFRAAALPAIGAAGGMVVPALLISRSTQLVKPQEAGESLWPPTSLSQSA